MERRKYLRYCVGLKAEAKKQDREGISGEIKDFSREGLRAVFDKFDFDFNAPFQLLIQRPNSSFSVPATVELVWKRASERGWDVGFRLKEFAPANKAEILEYGYLKWAKERARTP